MSSVGRTLYRSLHSVLREERRKLDYRGAWPSRLSLQGLAAAFNLTLDLKQLELAWTLEWENLLQSPACRDDPRQLLRPFFCESGDASAREEIEMRYPLIAEQLGTDELGRGFALMRLSSKYQDLLAEAPLSSFSSDRAPEPKQRPANLLFACGDVLEHRFFGHCVVVGWDSTCQQGEAWVKQNRIQQNLKYGVNQPFYNVLLEDNEIPRYCSQENLALLRSSEAFLPRAFGHAHAPFFFQPPVVGWGGGWGATDGADPRSFLKGKTLTDSFVPSEALAFIYPEDHSFSRGPRDYRSLDEAHSS